MSTKLFVGMKSYVRLICKSKDAIVLSNRSDSFESFVFHGSLKDSVIGYNTASSALSVCCKVSNLNFHS